jgi:charged multivesicular body protein 3
MCDLNHAKIPGIQREEEKVKRSLREAAKKGDRDVCIILAKEVLRARKAIAKIHTSKAHLSSIQMQMKNQLGIIHYIIILLQQNIIDLKM